MTAYRQLALPFEPGKTLFRAADFLHTGANEAARRWLARPQAWPNGRLALCGDEGAGKSHLLHAWAGEQAALVLEGAAIRRLPMLNRPAVALDDADMVPSAELLLHLVNAVAEAGGVLLLAGRLPAARWPVGLPDLASRLRATVSVELGKPDDDLLRSLLARQLADRQLAVSPAVQEWLLLRLPRSGAALREAAARLDRAALAAGHGIDREVAAAIVAELSGFDEAFAEAAINDSQAMPPLL